MTGVLVAALLLSAALHAGWNAAARSRPNSGEAFASMVIASGIWSLGALAFIGLPALASLPWIVAGILVNVVSLRALIAAYERTSFALAYPFARGLNPPMVLLIAFLVAGEWPRPIALAGLALVSLAVLALSLLARRMGARDLAGIGFAAIAAVGAGAAAVCDAGGVRLSGNPVGYSLVMAIANAITFALTFRLEGRKPFAGLIAKPGFAAFWSLVSMTSYTIILWGFTQADTALVAALRETSVLFATAFAALLLRERLTPLHWIASGLAAAGVVLIRLG